MDNVTDASMDAHTTRAARKAAILESLAVFILGAVLMHYVQTGAWGPAPVEPGVSGHDSFYHVKMASLMPELGLPSEFPHLRFCYFTEDGRFISNHYGFHALLMPFVKLSERITGDGLAGARLAIGVSFGLSLMLMNLILLMQGVRWRWLWLIAFVAMPFQFFTRHAYIRAIAPSLTFMLLLVLVMFRERHIWTALVVAAFTHLYLGGVVYAPVLVVAYVVCIVIGPTGERTIPWKLILFSFGGWCIGLLVHPYISGMFEWLRVQLFATGLSPDISVGREWKPYNDVWWFAQMAGALLVTWIIALMVRLRFGPRLNAKETALMLLMFIFLALNTKARRFVEYWPPFCLLSAATLAAPLINAYADKVRRGLAESSARLAVWFERAGVVVVLLAVFGVVRFSPLWRDIQKKPKCGYDLAAVTEMMDFVKEQAEPGDVIFTDDWDVFPVYFYHNAKCNYVVGLDPKLTHERRPDIWARFEKLSRGLAPKTVKVKMEGEGGELIEQEVKVTHRDIRDVFGARFVIIDSDHKKFSAKMNQQKDLAELIYPTTSFHDSRDEPYLVFRIKDGGD